MKLNSNYILSVETLRSSSIIKYLLFLCLVGLLLSAYWPGSMMWDSFKQYISYVKSSKASWIWLFSPLLPFIVSISGIIIKDLGMAYAFFCICFVSY